MNSAGRRLRYVYDLSCSGFVELMLTSAAENEEHVGKAIRESGVPREEIFVTTKLGYVFMFTIMLPVQKWLTRIQPDGVTTEMSLAALTPP